MSGDEQEVGRMPLSVTQLSVSRRQATSQQVAVVMVPALRLVTVKLMVSPTVIVGRAGTIDRTAVSNGSGAVKASVPQDVSKAPANTRPVMKRNEWRVEWARMRARGEHGRLMRP